MFGRNLNLNHAVLAILLMGPASVYECLTYFQVVYSVQISDQMHLVCTPEKKWKIECTYFTPLFGHKDVIMIKLHHEAHSSEWRCLLIYICTPDIISLEMSCCLRSCLSFHHWIRADFSSRGIRWFVGAHTSWDQSFFALMASYRNISSIVWKIVLGWSFQYFSFNCSVITTSQHISIRSNNVCSGIPTYPLLDTG